MLRIALMALAVTTLSACANGAAPDQAPLLGSVWEAISIDGQSVVQPGGVTLRFEDGRIGGKGGCNTYGGEARIDGATIKIGPIMSTKMACMRPGLMNQESRYFDALGKVDKIERTSQNALTLSGPNVALTFTRQAPPR